MVRSARLTVKKNRDCDSNTHVISFVNDHDSPVSIKPLTKSHRNIQICVGVAAVSEKAVRLSIYENGLFNSILIFMLQIFK